MAFSEVLWQQRIVQILTKILGTGRIANAYLFTGPIGTGKSSVAKLFAKSLNCHEGVLFSECSCEICARIERGTYPDVVEIFPDGAKMKVDQIRALKDVTRYGPSCGKWFTVILHNTETLTSEAANSFLKLLEEPPAGVVFVLLTPNLSAHLPTIRSRCQILHFSQLTPSMVRHELSTAVAAGVDEIVDIVGGELPLARLLSDDSESAWKFVRKFDASTDAAPHVIVNLAEEVTRQDKDELARLLEIYALTLMHKLKNRETSVAQKKALRRGINICFDMMKNLSNNINIRLHMEMMLLNMNRRAA